jgi:hypothetical protein
MHKRIVYILFICGLLASCGKPDTCRIIDRRADIYPSYEGTVIPYNIAPLNFAIHEAGSKFLVRFTAGADSFDLRCSRNVDIPLRKWKKLLATHRGEELTIGVFAWSGEGWNKYPDIRFLIAEEAIDPYLAYRLIEPGYVSWGKMGIYQRCLENFAESPVIENDLLDDGCVNCHSFNNNSPDAMLFHIRKFNAGTLILKDGKVSRIDTKTEELLSAGVYPRWHPGGRYIAFSVNAMRQNFHTQDMNKIEVYDMASDVVIFDTETNGIFTIPELSSEASFETFPEWSPNGDYLYYCSARARPMPMEYDSLRYELLRLPFDAATGNLGNSPDTLVSARQTHQSVALARVSPDNRFVVFCLSNYGTFPIWHRENDLYRLDLADGSISNLEEANSPESDSYHSWSSNGRWLVFSSRRMDGAYTRPYICYFDTDGRASKPFLLPQKSPEFYDFCYKSFNIPEFITGEINVSPHQWSRAARQSIIPAIFQPR